MRVILEGEDLRKMFGMLHLVESGLRLPGRGGEKRDGWR